MTATINKAAFEKVGEATEYCAFLERDGWDIATLHRVLPDEVSADEHKSACVDAEQWQDIIDLVAAAPALLMALQQAKNALVALADTAGDVEEWNEGGFAYEAAQTAQRLLDELDGE